MPRSAPPLTAMTTVLAVLACPAAIPLAAAATPDRAPAPNHAPTMTASHWGPEYSTPGAKLALVEVSRHVARPGTKIPYPDWAGKTIVRYRLKATGLDPGAKYRLWLRPSFHRPIRTRYLVHVDRTGNVTTESGDKLVFTIGDYHRGEPYSVGLASTDGTVKAMALAYPFPLRATAGRCRLILEMLAANGTMFAAFGTGFSPGAKVETVSRANGDVTRRHKTASPAGAVSMILAPPAIGADDHASYAIHARSCTVKVDYGIGQAALAPQ